MNNRQKDKEAEFAVQPPTIHSSYPVSLIPTKEVPESVILLFIPTFAHFGTYYNNLMIKNACTARQSSQAEVGRCDAIPYCGGRITSFFGFNPLANEVIKT